ncbi:hypothetical protein EYC84_012015 [Monilinia fructicola]|uniref:Uncharacterized protein n=1 Tax=Monilinia fructicola TaxID=38448 RepID=A0A5M9J4A7_MONFR|nr:hypothetical protein EYC84_012015 [Monilinia fructicola]
MSIKSHPNSSGAAAADSEASASASAECQTEYTKLKLEHNSTPRCHHQVYLFLHPIIAITPLAVNPDGQSPNVSMPSLALLP